jgi:hypothetical protein
MKQYDSFAIASISITCVLGLLLLFLLYSTRSNKKGLVWSSVTSVISMSRLLLIIAALVYSYGTINKQFDVAGYILIIAVAETLVLYLPIVVKRIALLKD